MNKAELKGRQVNVKRKEIGDLPNTFRSLGTVVGTIVDIGYNPSEAAFMFLVLVGKEFINVPSHDCELVE